MNLNFNLDNLAIVEWGPGMKILLVEYHEPKTIYLLRNYKLVVLVYHPLKT